MSVLPAWRSCARPWSISIAVWTLFVVLLMLRDTVFVRVHSWGHIPWAQVGGAELDWMLWGLLTPCVLTFSRKVRISASASPRIWFAYAGAAALTILVQVGGGTLIIAAWEWMCGFHTPFATILAMVALTRWHFDVLIFAGIVAVAQAIRSRREAAAFALQASRMEARLAQARLEALKSQLHPHFLFNSLHAVAALIVKNKSEVAVDVLSRLSDFLRIILDHTEVQTVSLKEELDLVRLYLAIQQVRFGDRLHVAVDVPPELLSAEVPYLLLQPLLENAIKYGVERHGGAGSVKLTAWQNRNGLHLQIMNGAVLGDIDGIVSRAGIGLGNTRERLRLLYGQRQQIDVRSDPDGQVFVEILLPLNQAESPVEQVREEASVP